MSQPSPKWGLSPETPLQGLVQVFTGDGRGKTTAALGTVVRALGQGRKVFIVFFMKGDYPYGERSTLGKLPGVDIESFGGMDFVYRDNTKPDDKKQAQLALASARKAMLGGKYDIVVLDEVCVATAFDLIPVSEVISLIKDKPPGVELILTGRQASPELIKIADLVTECRKIKHPYDKGIDSRRGIEY